MKNYHVGLMALFIILLSACHKKPFGVKGKGNTVNEIRSVSDFQKIKLSIDAELNYITDSAYFLEIHAQQNVINQIKTQIEYGELVIKSETFFYKHDPIKITVHAPKINSLCVSGSGKIICPDSLLNSDLKLIISGSGRIEASKIKTTLLNVQISGSGEVYLNGGYVSDLEYSISGSGKIDSEYLLSNHAKVLVSGSGNVILQVVQQLSVSISGSGTVKYHGNPQITTDINGSGKLIHI